MDSTKDEKTLTTKVSRCSVQTKKGRRCNKRTTYCVDNFYFCHIHRDKKDDTCNICFDPICKQLYVTKCNHRFHNGCILPWLMRQNTCPLCRYVFTQRLWITVSMYRNCSRKFNKGMVSYFWVETKNFRNYLELGKVFQSFLDEHPKEENKPLRLSRQLFFVTVNDIGRESCPISFKHLPDSMLDLMYGQHKSVKMNMLVNMIRGFA